VRLRRARDQTTRTGLPRSTQAKGRVRGRSLSATIQSKRLNSGAQDASAVLLSAEGGESASALAPLPAPPNPLAPRLYDTTRLRAPSYSTRHANEETVDLAKIQWFPSSDSESEVQEVTQLSRYLGLQVGSTPDAEYTWELPTSNS
jgi:hypothetical protein